MSGYTIQSIVRRGVTVYPYYTFPLSYHRITFSLILHVDADLSPILWIFGSLFLVAWIVNNY